MSNHPSLRAFAALTSAELETLAGGGSLAPAAGWHPVGQPGVEPEEEAAEEGMDAAADDAAEHGWPVVVVAADVEAPAGATPSAVEVRLADVAAFHLGDDVVSGGRLPAEAPWELSWYDVAEVDEVRRLLG
ncbi:hypothetical protein [Kytococcus sp. Marseille-QA3725]